jgi:SpoVK/Ycf46/Vps4 family AAA+-type ATPase
MQNLLLQEMEDFDGLLIATTNMESNFDPAFSRRFLYKLTVTKPDEIARFQLWQNKFPDFTKHELRQLASYDMTGAEIENIAIQSLCAEILEGNLPTLKSVLDMLHCYVDRLNTDTIGFKLSA